MGHKSVCFNCRKAFNRNINNLPKLETCPECQNQVVSYPHLFKPPRKTDLKAWNVVRFLYENGFIYHHIREDDNRYYAKYPDNLADAQQFVIKHKGQALKIAK
jgi:hypothetical protein